MLGALDTNTFSATSIGRCTPSSTPTAPRSNGWRFAISSSERCKCANLLEVHAMLYGVQCTEVVVECIGNESRIRGGFFCLKQISVSIAMQFQAPIKLLKLWCPWSSPTSASRTPPLPEHLRFQNTSASRTPPLPEHLCRRSIRVLSLRGRGGFYKKNFAYDLDSVYLL